MPTSLQKTRKQIAKKRGGQVNALHGKSRDSLRLRQASIRDMRLEKLAAARSKKEQPIGIQNPVFGESMQFPAANSLQPIVWHFSKNL